MKAMWIGFAAAIAISIGAWALLDPQAYSTSERDTLPSVRPPD